MNTVKSVYYGWATLIAAGGGAYYFAKKSINADRAAKAEADRAKRAQQYQLETAHGLYNGSAGGSGSGNGASANPSVSPNSVVAAGTGAKAAGGDVAGQIRAEDASASPSVQASGEVAATGREGGSKYEASGVYRSRKGDRFS